MKFETFALLSSAALLSACNSTQERPALEASATIDAVELVDTSEPVATESEAVAESSSEAVDAPVVDAPVADALSQPAAKADREDDGSEVLPSGFWDDPDFQQRFRDSYLSETDIEPPISFEERELLEEVTAFISEERFEEALELLAEEMTPQSTAIFDYYRGNIGFQNGDSELAIDGYEAAVDKFPKFRRAWMNLGILETQEGNHREAVAALTKVLELGGASSVTYAALGTGYLNLQNPIAADSAFRMAILLDPDEPNWKLGLARSFFLQKRFDEAVALCETLIAEDPGNSYFWLLQANALLVLEDLDRAAENFEFVDRLGASTQDSLLLLGGIYANKDLFDMANDAYARAFELAEGEPKTGEVMNAGRLMVAREQYDDAQDLLALVESAAGEGIETGLRLDILDLRARIAVAEGNGGEQAAMLEEIIALDPMDGDALVRLGRFEKDSGNPERAELLFDRALGLEEFEFEAAKAKAALYVSLERYNEAVPLLNRALAIKDSQPLRDYLETVKRLGGVTR